MAKIKLLSFELAAMLEDGKRLLDFLQQSGVTELAVTKSEDALTKYHTDTLQSLFEQKKKEAERAVNDLQKYCKIKRSLLSSFTDVSEIELYEYRRLCDDADDLLEKCRVVNDISDKIAEQQNEILRQRTLIDYYKPWESLDIPMCIVRTETTNVFIGYFKQEISKKDLLLRLSELEPESQGVEAEIVSSSKSQTCVVVVCNQCYAKNIELALRSLGFIRPDNPAKDLPKKAIEKSLSEIEKCEEIIEQLKIEASSYAQSFVQMRMLCDYYTVQSEKYSHFEKSATSENVLFIEGFVPERDSEQLKFDVERKFTAELRLKEPDYENDDVPVLIENKGFAGGVESISNMYSPPSNNDFDPNPVMAFFYYALFGLMLSDGGYGLLMVAVALFAKLKLRVSGDKLKTINFVFYCGISTTIWGALFGGWFGDLIPTVCKTFLGMENPPNLAIWFSPTENSMKMLLFSFLFGLVHLYTGLAIRFCNLVRQRQTFGAFCDVVPVMVFVAGFAIFGAGMLTEIPEKAQTISYYLLLIGAVLIVLTSGRSAKNIIGKFGGGLYGLYSTTTGYLGDILSYSRLLALSLVTGVIASVVNMLGAMLGNVFLFILVFIVGHAINLSVNLIGTYVHTSRLQYVEYFSKFYEGGGRLFTPLKINMKHFKIKEETIND